MIEVDLYENVRQKLSIGLISTPKHEKIAELMRVIWNEEEIKILSHFPKSGKLISIKELVEKTGIPKKEIRLILKNAVKKHTIAKLGARYGLVPLLPGVFEGYFTARTDTKENLNKAARIYRFLIKNLPSLVSRIEESKLKEASFTSPLLPYEAQERLIKIDETMEIESKVISTELVKDMIDKNELFGALTCPCRFIGEVSGEPCLVAPAELGCFAVGVAAQVMIQAGVARSLTKEEAIDFIKKTEEAGLVHNAIVSAQDQIITICNCCNCHCGLLFPTRQTKYQLKFIGQSNFAPKHDPERCILCEKCMEICPMEVISHPSGEDKLLFNLNLCIGCGICAANCPENAILMEKIRDVPKASFGSMPKGEGEVSFEELFQAIMAGG